MNNLNRKQIIIPLPSSFLLVLLLLVISSSSSIISVSATETTTNNNLRKSSTSTTTSTQDNRNLIVGGKDANVKTYPRSIVYLSDRLDHLSCGGTLISPTIVLAAAHCEISLVSDAVFQRYYHPSEASKVGINSSKEIRIPVKEEIKHPNYNRRTLENDVMLLILEKSPNDYVSNNNDNTTQHDVIPYMKLHKPSDPSLDELAELMRIVEEGDGKSNRESIKNNNNSNNNNNNNDNRLGHKLRSDATAEEALLNGQSSSPNQTPLKLTALGWGHTVSGGKGQPSDTLKEARLNYVYNSECNKAQESNLVNYDGRISQDMMCTWHSQQDTCHGDSGGPIVFENFASTLRNANDNTVSSQRDQYIQVGIVSWGEDCADAIFPGVASRVSESYEWIRRRVCSIDGTNNQTPENFDCDELVTNTDTDTKLHSSTFSPAPSSSPSSKIDKFDAQARTDAINLLNGGSDTSGSAITVDATVEIYLDVFAIEQGWKLVEIDTGIAVRDFPFGSYQFENFIKEEVQLTVGKTYNFTIYDQYGDGITNNGYYRIYYTADNNTEEQEKEQEQNQIDLVEKSEFGGREQSDKFTVSADSTSTSTSTSTSGWSLSSSQTTPATTATITTQETSSQGRNEGRNKKEYRIGQIP